MSRLGAAALKVVTGEYPRVVSHPEEASDLAKATVRAVIEECSSRDEMEAKLLELAKQDQSLTEALIERYCPIDLEHVCWSAVSLELRQIRHVVTIRSERMPQAERYADIAKSTADWIEGWVLPSGVTLLKATGKDVRRAADDASRREKSWGRRRRIYENICAKVADDAIVGEVLTAEEIVQIMEAEDL